MPRRGWSRLLPVVLRAELSLGAGIIVGHGTVELLMRRAGIKGLPGSRRPRPKHQTPTWADLVRRQFAARSATSCGCARPIR
jgi:hypothetical protein